MSVLAHQGLLMSAENTGPAILWRHDGDSLSGWTLGGNPLTVEGSDGSPAAPCLQSVPGSNGRVDTGVSLANRNLRLKLKLIVSGSSLTNLKIGGTNANANYNFRVDGRAGNNSGLGAVSSWSSGGLPAGNGRITTPFATGVWHEFLLQFWPDGTCGIKVNGDYLPNSNPVANGAASIQDYALLGTWMGMYTDSGVSSGGRFDSITIEERAATPSGYYKRYRLEWTANNGDTTYAAVQEVEFALGFGGSDVAGTVYRALAGGTGSNLTSPYLAFNNDFADPSQAFIRNWTSGAAWLELVLPEPVLVDRVRITAQNTGVGPGRALRDFVIKGSNDGSTWVTLATPAAQTGWGQGVTREFVW